MRSPGFVLLCFMLFLFFYTYKYDRTAAKLEIGMRIGRSFIAVFLYGLFIPIFIIHGLKYYLFGFDISEIFELVLTLASIFLSTKIAQETKFFNYDDFKKIF